MGIHHATKKKAEGLGIVLTEIDGEIEARWPKLNKVVAHDDAKAALNLAMLYQRFGEEYRKVRIAPSEAEEGLWATFDANSTEMVLFDPLDDIEQVFVDTLEFASDNDCDIEDTTEHVVVPEHYKQLYKERGNPNHCGDWLAKWLDGRFLTAGDKKQMFNADAFEMFLRENGVDMDGKWASLPQSGQKGWEGRYRMNGRQKLEKRIAHTGKLVRHGEEIKVPKTVLKELAEKHPAPKPKKVEKTETQEAGA